MKSEISNQRIQVLNAKPVSSSGRFVLYWMIAARRTTWNFALQRAVEWSNELRLPLLIFEALRSDYRWASDRLHRFVLDGMADNSAALSNAGVRVYSYVEEESGAGKGLLRALAEHSAVVVTDEFPSFGLPRMVESAARKVPVRLETIDGNGLLPLRSARDRVFPTAYAFRRFLQRELPEHLLDAPAKDPLHGLRNDTRAAIPRAVTRRWPVAGRSLLEGGGRALAALPIDHGVPVAPARGGPRAAAKCLDHFLKRNLARYVESRNDLDDRATSGLSAYLHFGHVSAHEILAKIAAREKWRRERLSPNRDGKREGWWGMSPGAEAFLDQLVTWRELGYNMAFHEANYDRYGSLPNWARETLSEHAGDERRPVYSLLELEEARTHDELWNAAQRELRRHGVIHNYLRMLWGKKILEWSRSPEEALHAMIELNNKYALDGRNPNSYSGIFWILGRYDRPWGPERPIFGKVRYMSSENTARKIRVKGYLSRFGVQESFA